MKQFFGKFRGKVAGNVDPLQLGRLQVMVPVVYADGQLNWAMPCVPYGGDGVGFFMIPPVDANVWVEFEEGDIDRPIWSGCFWTDGQVPASPATPEMKVLKTDTATITVNDTKGAGSITIELASGQKIVLTSNGIEIDDGQGGKISLQGPKVSVNDGALEVT